MPIFGRYLLKNYLNVLLLSVVSFITILLVSRLEEIAHFASLGAPLGCLFAFTLYQIPYILPIAIPISCLISAMILFQRLSQTHEITALRASGLSLKQIIAPILIAGAFLSLSTFYITSELATSSHLASRKMIHELTSVNPLILLQSAKIAKLRGSYVQMDPVQNGRTAKNIFIAFKNQSNGRIHLCLAKKVGMKNGELHGSRVSIISSIPRSDLGTLGEEEDHLIIENQESLTTSAPELASLLRKKGWKIANDHLKLSLLLAREKILREDLSNPKTKKNLSKCQSELIRRFSLGIAAFTFTLLGISFGVEISRNKTKRGLIFVILLTSLTLITFFVGKEFDHLFWIASSFFILPHFLITSACLWSLSRVNKGII